MKYALIAFLALPIAGFAQGSGTVTPPPSTGGGVFDNSDLPFTIIKSVTGKILHLGEKGEVVVLLENGQKKTVVMTKSVKVRANKGTEFATKKKIETADLSVGMIVKVTYRAEDDRTFEIKILKDSAA